MYHPESILFTKMLEVSNDLNDLKRFFKKVYSI